MSTLTTGDTMWINTTDSPFNPITIGPEQPSETIPVAKGDNSTMPNAFRFDDIQDVRVPAYGYIWPIIAVMVVVTSLLICSILFSKKMRTPTNLVLGSIAIANMLTCAPPAPLLVYIFLGGYYQDYIEYQYCMPFKITILVIPVMSHTISIWLMVFLAFQRAIVIKCPFRGPQWITMKSTIIVIVAVYVAGIAGHLVRALESTYVPVTVPSLIYPNKTVLSCAEEIQPWIVDLNLYYSTYYWARALLMNVIPCTILVVLTVILVNALKAAYRRRKRMTVSVLKQKDSDTIHTNSMLVIVVFVFLLVELPVAVLIVIVVLPNSFGVSVIDPITQGKMLTVADMVILGSYPLNFFIYSAMSKKFREVFIKKFCCWANIDCRPKLNHSAYELQDADRYNSTESQVTTFDMENGHFTPKSNGNYSLKQNGHPTKNDHLTKNGNGHISVISNGHFAKMR